MIKLTDILSEVNLEEGVNDPGIFKAVFLAGGPGSGKSYIANTLFGFGKFSFSVSGLKLVNSDRAFETFMKQNDISLKLNDLDPETRKQATVLRSKAKEKTGENFKMYQSGRLGVLVDGTGNDFYKIKHKADKLKALGYDCLMVMVNTSLDVAQQRNLTRARSVEPAIVESIWENVQASIPNYKKYFRENYVEIDNNSNNTPIKPEILKAVRKFLSDPVQNPIGKKWIDTNKV
jgi:predicted kinase